MPKNQSTFPAVTFSVTPTYLEDNGLWNPQFGAPPLEAGFQVNVFGSREHYLRLAEAIKEFALRNTANDADYHTHIDGLLSVNGKVRLDFIFRKDDVGNSQHRQYFPPRE